MDDLARAWDERIDRLLARAPKWGRSAVGWLRKPSRRPVRVLAAVLFTAGGVFSILPVLGIWMLPLGLALLAEDIPGMKPSLERSARWCARRWQAWFGPKPAAQAGIGAAGPETSALPSGQPPRIPVRPPSGV
jgi:hypothetical protein